MRRFAIVVNCNEAQLPQLDLFVSSARNNTLGDFVGDFWAVSTLLGEKGRAYCAARNIQCIENSLDWIADWESALDAAIFTLQDDRDRKAYYAEHPDELQYLSEWDPSYFATSWVERRELLSVGYKRVPDSVRGKFKWRNELMTEALRLFRNKRMSKLIFLDFLELHGEKYDRVLFCDTDIYIQSDLDAVFEQIGSGHVYFEEELSPIHVGSSLWNKNYHYRRLMGGDTEIESIRHEMNIGFLGANPETAKIVFERHKELYLRGENAALIPHGWHDQDFFRVIKSQFPELFCRFEYNSVRHLCNGGEMNFHEREPFRFSEKSTDHLVPVVHFAGGVWRNYKSVTKCYSVNLDTFFSYCNLHRSLISEESSVSGRGDFGVKLNESESYATPEILRQSSAKNWISFRSRIRDRGINCVRIYCEDSLSDYVRIRPVDQDLVIATVGMLKHRALWRERHPDVIILDFEAGALKTVLDSEEFELLRTYMEEGHVLIIACESCLSELYLAFPHSKHQMVGVPQIRDEYAGNLGLVFKIPMDGSLKVNLALSIAFSFAEEVECHGFHGDDIKSRVNRSNSHFNRNYLEFINVSDVSEGADCILIKQFLLEDGETSEIVPKVAVSKVVSESGKYLRLVGWTIGRAPIEKIQIFEGDRLLGHALHGEPRPDIASKYPGPLGENRGFEFYWNPPEGMSLETLHAKCEFQNSEATECIHEADYLIS
ncbi:MAG: hypothetical protein MK080_01775 [Opitutales bacterium]|nr:hypothetical protein [Opitutales bacterium]